MGGVPRESPIPPPRPACRVCSTVLSQASANSVKNHGGRPNTGAAAGVQSARTRTVKPPRRGARRTAPERGQVKSYSHEAGEPPCTQKRCANEGRHPAATRPEPGKRDGLESDSSKRTELETLADAKGRNRMRPQVADEARAAAKKEALSGL